MVKHIKTVEEFAAEIKEGKVVVDFYATWCGPCRMMAPVLDQLSEELSDIKFLKVDIDELSQLASGYNIYSVPTFLILKDGEIVKEQIGGLPLPAFKAAIKKVLP